MDSKPRKWAECSYLYRIKRRSMRQPMKWKKKKKKSLVWSDSLWFSCSYRANHVSALLTAGAPATLAPFRKPEKQILNTMKPFGKVRDTLRFHWKKDTFRSTKVNYPMLSHGSPSIFLYKSVWGYRDTDILTTENLNGGQRVAILIKSSEMKLYYTDNTFPVL